jgi:hypothetical protein
MNATPLGLEIADRGLDVGHLEVGNRVLGDRRGALEDREFAHLPTAKADAGRVLPQELQSQRLPIEGLRSFEVADGSVATTIVGPTMSISLDYDTGSRNWASPPAARLRGFQAAEEVHHRRRNIGVVMDYPPLSRFAAVDVRDALLDGDLLSRNLGLPFLYTYFVGQIAATWIVWSRRSACPPEASLATP